MKWMNKLEFKYRRYAIKNLIFYIIAFNALIFVLDFVVPRGVSLDVLVLYPRLVLQGEVWRLVTYIFLPPSSSPIWIIFILYFYYLVGTGLEQAWGAFRFNVYYILGMIGTTIAAFITGAGYTGVYLNLSLFFAFAHLFPDFQILLFFILPIKVKYLAWLNWILLGVTVFTMPLPHKLAVVAAVLNYLVFFGPDIYRNIRLRRRVQLNRKKFFSEVRKGQRNARRRDD
ncbi:MAG: rhomboid family intramembrane serine protease [Firmicutes bacterium]|nr:rhomboid family intramembrane serine protease [Bacillota bacterium]